MTGKALRLPRHGAAMRDSIARVIHLACHTGRCLEVMRVGLPTRFTKQAHDLQEWIVPFYAEMTRTAKAVLHVIAALLEIEESWCNPFLALQRQRFSSSMSRYNRMPERHAKSVRAASRHTTPAEA